MSGRATELSKGLADLAADFANVVGEAEGISIEQAEVLKLVRLLTVMQSLATNLEIEVRCLRDMEAGRDTRNFLDDEATGHLAAMLPKHEGNVVRFDFGKGGRS